MTLDELQESNKVKFDSLLTEITLLGLDLNFNHEFVINGLNEDINDEIDEFISKSNFEEKNYSNEERFNFTFQNFLQYSEEISEDNESLIKDLFNNTEREISQNIINYFSTFKFNY